MISALLFDLDGTLVDSADDIITSAIFGFEEVGLKGVGRDRLSGLLGYSLVELYDVVCRDGDGDRRSAFVQSYRRHYTVHCTDRTTVYPGVRETLPRLSRFRLGIATTKPSHTAKQILDALDLSRYFAVIRGCEGLPNKPDPALLLTTLDLLGIPPTNAAMVGDTDRDILAAKAAGMRSIAVTYGGWSRGRLEGLAPDVLIDNFEQLSDATAGW